MKEVFEKEMQIKVLERLKDYTDFTYMNYVVSTNQNHFIQDYQNQIETVIVNFGYLCKNEFEAKCLGVYVLEISHICSIGSREKNLNNQIKPMLNPGTKELMEAIDAFELSPYNIEEIIIKTKQPKEYIKDQSYHPKEYKKGSYLKDLRISGRIAINRIMRGVQNDNTKNELSSIIKQKKQEKNRTNYYKKGATLLYPYLEKYFDHLPSNNERYFLGANLLHSIGLEPKYRNVETESAFKKAMVNNFKKALNS